MLRDNLNTYNPPTHDDLSVIPNHEVLLILDFIDRKISGFRSYYIAIKDSNRENRISDFLVYYFNTCLLDEVDGFRPFNFGKNPTQPQSGKETDIGVVVLTKNVKPLTIIEFEAKRFSTTSQNKEYVCGERGGIERFKRGQHAPHLSVCGMFGYIQNDSSLEWINKINTWITELSENNIDSTIDWKGANEILIKLNEFEQVEKWISTNSRINMQPIKLHHYFISLN